MQTENRVTKPWGEYIVLEQKERYWIKKLFVKEGARLSLQSHKDRAEVWVVLSGKIEATKGDSRVELGEGEYIKIEKNEKHRISGIKDSWILEAAFGDAREDDITRFEDDYGRIQ
ncbi:MAG: phosphomannose isomerase type II C-terminal cupin domain [Parcubacteria group bacterium]|nr:phosphomannose isomerase type II C-terminal cupin domain [Parcubacteria group bacterium]MBI3075351.1 phosphomannose isomerase type II C-terminal cupin domain [Parcubacteria group bacterium]